MNILIIAPHPDDETLGCGGVILRHRQQGDDVVWMLATGMCEEAGYSTRQIEEREKVIQCVYKLYGFADLIQLGHAPARLDTVPMGTIVSAIHDVVARVQPTTIYLPYPGDAHTDHGVIFVAGSACTKWFRHPSVRRVLAYETLSETNQQIRPDLGVFRPNHYVNIQTTLEEKMRILDVYAAELGRFPFPRSPEAVRALAQLRGSESGFHAAEAFMLLMDRVS